MQKLKDMKWIGHRKIPHGAFKNTSKSSPLGLYVTAALVLWNNWILIQWRMKLYMKWPQWGKAKGCHLMLTHLSVCLQLHETLHRKKEEIDSLQGRNLHLRQLASRAKHLASVLEVSTWVNTHFHPGFSRTSYPWALVFISFSSTMFLQKLMTVRDPHVREAAMPCSDKTSLSPCKRQRLDEGYETESSDSVEDMLRDISTRCNAVLHGAAAGTKLQQESESICMYGSFSGLQTSTSKGSSTAADGAESEEIASSFRTSVREHCTIRTQVFPHGRAFTSRTQQGGYRFRWVPNHSWSRG